MATAPETVPPVFLFGKTLPAVEEKEFTVIELCTAAGKIKLQDSELSLAAKGKDPFGGSTG